MNTAEAQTLLIVVARTRAAQKRRSIQRTFFSPVEKEACLDYEAALDLLIEALTRMPPPPPAPEGESGTTQRTCP